MPFLQCMMHLDWWFQDKDNYKTPLLTEVTESSMNKLISFYLPHAIVKLWWTFTPTRVCWVCWPKRHNKIIECTVIDDTHQLWSPLRSMRKKTCSYHPLRFTVKVLGKGSQKIQYSQFKYDQMIINVDFHGRTCINPKSSKTKNKSQKDNMLSSWWLKPTHPKNMLVKLDHFPN